MNAIRVLALLLAAGFAPLMALCDSAGIEPAVDYPFRDEISLDGDWEMAYSPYFLEVATYPTFAGKVVKNAIPGYWEDMIPAFRAAGINDTFRINPEYTERSLPQTGWAPDTQLPQPYGTFFYRRTVNLSHPQEAVLAFEGVRNEVYLWVNRRFVAFRQGYSTPFTLAIPDDYLKEGANEITLAVANRLNLGYVGTHVRGLTSRALFRATGGVNGHLALQFIKSDVHDIAVTLSEDLQTCTIRANGRDSYEYEFDDAPHSFPRSDILRHPERYKRTSGRGRGNTTVRLDLGLQSFWSPDYPTRMALRITSGGRTITRNVGFRRLTAKGDKLFLNGEPVYLRGVTEHCYFPQTVHLPRDINYYRMITKKRKELGFNFVRFHTFVPPVEYLEAMDELGMMAEIESPNYVTESEYAAIIAFTRSHPSVVMYSTGNETRIDRLAETYLREISDMVHARTDALFSPMSALRGVSYLVFDELEPVVAKPYRHNQERADRLAKFCDLFNACSNSGTSYNYIDGPDSNEIDSWLPFYAGKPRLLHETCIDGTYADLTLESMYPKDSPIVKTKLFSEVRRVLTEKGIVDRAGLYFTNSCAWVALARKVAFERARACETIAGFDFLGDINTHWHTYGYSVGMMDEFYRLKPFETVEHVRRYNSDFVFLADFGTDFVCADGATRPTKITVSNFAYPDEMPVFADFYLTLVDEADGRAVYQEKMNPSSLPHYPCGSNTVIGTYNVKVPRTGEARHYRLQVRSKSWSERAAIRIENEWDLYAFPVLSKSLSSEGVRVVGDLTREGLLDAMGRGESVVLLGTGPFKTSPMSFNTGRAGRCSGNFATVIKKDHPALAHFPNDGYCGWQFRRLMDKAKVLQMEADIPFDPIIDVASAVKCPIRQAALVEYRVGKGRLLVCTFNFHANDPAASFLKAQLVAYAASPAFDPKDAITVDQLREWIDTPEVKTTGNPNRAKNPGDPSSYVRTGADMMP